MEEHGSEAEEEEKEGKGRKNRKERRKTLIKERKMIAGRKK